MRILILGKNYNAQSFYELFSQNQENIVFTTIKNQKNYIKFFSYTDIIDFCTANEINFVIIIDEKYINFGLDEAISSLGITVFSPSSEAMGIIVSKNYAKKFMHKNKIKTPKFSVQEKPQCAYDYINENKFPLTIKPDNRSLRECPLFCETLKQAKTIVDNFFNSGNKKIIIEDYIEGKNITIWTLSDGYNAKIIGKCAKYQNNVAVFNPDFLLKNKDLDNILYSDFINPTLQALSTQEEEYVGILGFDFIQTFDNQLFLIGYNSFFDDICVDFFTKGYDIDWLDVFERTIIGDVFQKYTFTPKNTYMLTLKQGTDIEFLSANTKNSLNNYIFNLDIDTKELSEAKHIWKF